MPEKIAKIFHRIFTSTNTLIRLNPISAVLGAAGLILFVYGLISLLASSQGQEKIIFEDASSNFIGERAQDEKNAGQVVIIDVEGAVEKPGVYRLTGQPRIKDALIAAAGLSSYADRDWVAKNINLAQKLTDGGKVYIPQRGEGSKETVKKSGNVGPSININTAALAELETLPGIGQVTGQKIIDNRPYSDIQELLSKKVLGAGVFEKIKEKIVVY